MILIAHRGNIDGKNPDKENNPDYIMEAIDKGFNVEIDVWYIKDTFYLGHDKPQYPINIDFLKNDLFWIHTKNIEAIHQLNNYTDEYTFHTTTNFFFHNTDDCVLTSWGWIWTYPDKPILSDSAIAVLPELFPNWDISLAGGICSDFISRYKKINL